MRNTSGLVKPWKPGQSGNPGGRPKGSLYLVEALRMCSDKTELELQTIFEDEDERVMLRAAARLLLLAVKAGTHKTETTALEVIREIMDRLDGKPTRMVEKREWRVTASPSQLLAELRAVIGEPVRPPPWGTSGFDRRGVEQDSSSPSPFKTDRLG